MNYFNKMKGFSANKTIVSLSEVFWSWIGAFIGIGVVAYLNYNILNETDCGSLVIKKPLVNVSGYVKRNKLTKT